MMIQGAQVNMAGFLAAEPKFKKVAGDISTARLRVACTERRQNRETGEWSDGATSFVNVQCWRQLADNVSVCLRKGEPVLVSGRMHVRRYEDAEGKTRITVEVEANSVGHDLTRGVAHFSRIRKPMVSVAEAAGNQATDSQDGETEARTEFTGAAGDGVLDERAVAEFAKELSDSFGPGAPGGAGLTAGDPEPAGAGSDDAGAAGAEALTAVGV